MPDKMMSAKLLKAFGKRPLPEETEAQRKERALGVLTAMLNEGRISTPRAISAPGFKPSRIATLVLSTVNAPYGTHYDASDLAALICDPDIATRDDPAVFSFFSEVDVKLQVAFLQEHDIHLDHVKSIVRALSRRTGYNLPLTHTLSDFLDAGDGPSV